MYKGLFNLTILLTQGRHFKTLKGANPLTYTDTKQDFYKEMLNAHPLVVDVNIVCLPWVGESCLN